MPIISLSYYSTLQISENGLSISAISCMRKYIYTEYVNYKNNEPIRSIVTIIPSKHIFKGIVLDDFGIAEGDCKSILFMVWSTLVMSLIFVVSTSEDKSSEKRLL